MHTKDKLAAELNKIGLMDMAIKAANGYYHDFLSPLATPCLQLAADLAAAGTPEAMALRDRHINGEFDATQEEADAWAASPEGRDAFGQLAAGRKSNEEDRLLRVHAAMEGDAGDVARMAERAARHELFEAEARGHDALANAEARRSDAVQRLTQGVKHLPPEAERA